MIALFYLIIVEIIAVNGCNDDTLLMPDKMIGDVNGYELSRMLDGMYNTYWRANNNGGENVYFYFPAEVEVKWIFVQRYGNNAQYVYVYDSTRQIATHYFGDSTEYYDTITMRFDDVYTDELRFYFYDSGTVYISRLEVHGCYNTSEPTPSPTTAVPSWMPTSFPTVSPTLAPLTATPSEMPTTRPTTAPSVSPSIANPSPYPSTAPSLSPTKLPSVETVIPSLSPTSSPTILISTTHPSEAPSSSPTFEPTIGILPPSPSISPTQSPTVPPTVVYATNGGFQITLGAIELFSIVIFCLCGVLLVIFLRYRKAILANEVLNNVADEANHTYPCYSVNDYMMITGKAHNKGGVTVMQTGNGCNAQDRVMQINKTRHIVGEDSRQDGNDHHVVTKTRNTRGGDGQKSKDHHIDIRRTLDKVSSDNKTCHIVGEDSKQDGNNHHVTRGADRQEAKDHHVDIRLALDKVSSDNKTCNIVGEDSRQDGNDHHVTRGADGQEAKDHHVDIRFALDKVSSDNGEVFNREGDLEIGRQESAL